MLKLVIFHESLAHDVITAFEGAIREDVRNYNATPRHQRLAQHNVWVEIMKTAPRDLYKYTPQPSRY